MKRFLYISLCFALVLVGCKKKDSVTTQDRSLAQLSRFSFAAVDSIPGLAKATFTIKELLDTGLVENVDSMLYGTLLDHVVPRFVFAATPGEAFLTFPDTVVSLTGYDTLDFTVKPIYLTIKSADKSNTKVYEICPTVHQVDPDLYTWTCINDGIYPNDDSEQRVVVLNNDFVMIASNGFELHAFRSPNGATWTDLGAPAGLPAGTKVRQIISDNTTLYYAQDSTVYTSTDAVTWTGHKMPHGVITMLLHWNEKIWLIAFHDGKFEFATFADGTLSLTGIQPDGGNFPISDFATVTFHSPSGRDRAMIIGGFAENGRSLNTRWNLEYSPHTQEDGGYRVEEFSIDRPQFTSLTGISVISYNDQLLLFGGVDDNMNYFGRDILISEDEGLNWTVADTAKNQLPAVYQARQKQTAIVRDNNIYLFGGQDSRITYSDVYKGHLNSIDW